ncbi:MAG TPA: LysM domain-containing protein, partial [Caldilineaceae bacterium]|nr:LysM domain-containing protein [Caldilineaceae bacterium]
MSATLPALPLRLKTGLALLLAVILLLFALPPATFAQEDGQAADEATAQGHAGAPSTITYIVKRGDTLSAIARRYNTTVAAILKLNPQIRNPNRLWVGQRILIPVAADRPADFTRTRIYLVALDDGGTSGQPIGCNDSLVPVTVDIPATRAILRGSLEKLLSLRDA